MTDRDLDKSGFGFQRVRTYLGPSLGWIDELVQPTTEIKTGGIHLVAPGESLILVSAAAPVQISLPDVRIWMQQTAYQPATGFDRSITVKDIGGNANNFNIVVAPFGQQTIDNIQTSIVISVARAVVRVIPLIDLSGWAVETASTGGGGGGGGDVFKAGNNTFTGVNTFQNTVTALTPGSDDNTNNVATTKFVKDQNYITGAALVPYAPLNSPVFTGTPMAPTPPLNANDSTVVTVGFVEAALAGFGGGAPVNAEYVLGVANVALPAGRIFENTGSITWDLSTPGKVRATTAAGGGNVSNVGTPVSGQLAQWTSPTLIQGIAISSLGFAPINNPVFTGDPQAPTPAVGDNDTSIATTAYVKANLANFQPVGNYQPLDGDLTAISALLGTNTIYYRSATDIWSPVTFSGLSFSGGVLTVTAGGGNVSNSGTPTVNQVAVWTDATHIKGVAASTLVTNIQTGFRAYKPADQTGIANNVPTKITFITEDYDLGGFYDAPNSRWTPPAGLVHFDVGMYISSGAVATANSFVVLYKNGVSLRQTVLTMPFAVGGIQASFDDNASGTDFYEIYIISGTDGNGTIMGFANNTWWSGHVTGGPKGDVGAVGPSGTTTGAFGPPQGRLTLASGQPVMSATISSATTIYYTPYIGDKIPIFDGTNWTMMGFAEVLSTIAGAAADKNQDWFVWNDVGVIKLIKGPDWTNNTTRALSLVRVNGIWMNSSAITSGPAAQRGTWVGTTRTYLDVAVLMKFDLGVATVGGRAGHIGLWNAYNRVPWSAAVCDTTDSWTYTTLVWRRANASSQMYVAWVTGQNEGIIEAIYNCVAFTSASSGRSGIGYNGDTAPATNSSTGNIGVSGNYPAILTQPPGLGYNFVYAIEYGQTGMTFYGDAGLPGVIQSGFHVTGQY